MNVQDIKKVACLGTGTMGPGVAFLCAKAGYDVTMFGRSPESLERGFAAVEAALNLYIANGLLPSEERSSVIGRITGATNLSEAAKDADFVIESVTESLEIKHDVFKIVESVVKPETVLATDTSGLSPTKIASVLKHPERFVVTHFINPPHLIPAVEVVSGEKTLPSVKKVAAEWVKHIGNTPIEMEREVPGFIINRLQYACLREALYMVEQGWASAKSVDAAMRYSLGRRYPVTGPLETADLGGLDTFSNVARYLYKELCIDQQAPDLLFDTVAAGHFGVKSGEGLYKWDKEEADGLRAAREKELVEWLKKDIMNSK